MRKNKFQDNSINIGDNNTIKKSNIGCVNVNSTSKKPSMFDGLFWKLLIPIAVVVISTLICVLLKLK